MTGRLHQPALFSPPAPSIDRTVELWEVVALGAKRSEAAAGFEALHQILSESGIVADLSLVVAGGARGPARAWFGAQVPDGLEPPFTEIRRTAGVAAPWLELGLPSRNRPLPVLGAPCGAVFRFTAADTIGVRPARSALLTYLQGGEPWQVTITAGLMSAHSGDDVYAGVGVTLLCGGLTLSLAGPLLSLDLSREQPVAAEAQVLDDASLAKVRAMARWGLAPSRGAAPRSVVADLFSLVAGCDGSWSSRSAAGPAFERRAWLEPF